MLVSVNELNAGDEIVVSFADADNASAVPDTVDYRVDCLSTNTVIKDWMPIAPGAQVTIVLDENDTRIFNAFEKREFRRVTISANRLDGLTRQTEEYGFYCRPMLGLDGATI